jgi:hypothetical protein
MACNRDIFTLPLDGCKTWFLTLREEHRQRVFENRILRTLFGPKWNEVGRGWRKLHNKELHNMCSSPSKIRMIKSRRMIWAGHVERMGEKRSAYRILVGKPEGKRPQERPRWVHDIKVDHRGGMDWIDLAQDRD